MDKSYFVYILTNYNNKVLYTGVTNNVVRRVYEHKQKLIPGFTKKYNVKKLIHFESYQNPNDAIAREKQIKAGSRRKKINLIEQNNPKYNDLYDKIV